MTDDGPRQLTDSQEWVRVICDAFGWLPALKAGHAATLGKNLRTKVGATWQEFEQHYGRVDPGVGVWWVYREVYPCQGLLKEPTPKIVTDSWGRWERATAVLLPPRAEPAGYDSLREFLARPHDAHT